MTQLKKITVSHLRKYADDVVIPIERGATVFLAPNGTGKTAIFEAVELALTGQVSRLTGSSLNALIRDHYQTATVRMDFEDNLYCEAKLKKDESPVISGSHSQLFGEVQKESVPFLLRLTHLLDQQSNNWFVHTQGDRAGHILDNLSIGRDAIRANGLISSTKKSITSIKDLAERKRADILSKLEIWNALIEKRQSSHSAQSVSLKPKESILNELETIGQKLGIQEKGNIQTSELLSFCSQIDKTNDFALKSYNERKLLLQNLITVATSYPNLIKEQEAIGQNILTQRSSVQTLEKDLADFQEKILNDLRKLTSLQESLDTLESTKRQSDQLDKAKEDKTRYQQTVLNLQSQISALTKEIQDAEISYQNALKDLETQELLQKRKQLVANRIATSNYWESVLIEWQASEHSLINFTNAQTTLQSRLTSHLQSVKNKENDCENLERIFQSTQESYNNLNQANDAIRQAVGIIASHLPEDRSDCPVCSQEYPPLELHNRISKAISAIDPQLEQYRGLLEKARVDIETAKNALTTDKILGEEIEKELTIITREILSINSNINHWRNNVFSGVMNIADAYKAVNDEKASINELQKILDQETTNKTPLSQDHLLSLESILINLKTQADQLTGNLSDYSSRIVALNETEKVLVGKVKEASDVIQTKIINAQLDLEKLKIAADSDKNTKIEMETKLAHERMTLNSLLAEQKRISDNIGAQIILWKDAAMSDNPDMGNLNTALESIENLINDSKKLTVNLQQTQLEITRWQSHENYYQINSEIKNLIGEIDEEEYDLNLKKQLADAEKELQEILERYSTLNTFSNKLGHEIDSIHEKLQSINPYWNKLLKRIVIDPRFASAFLASYSHYKKPYANVNVEVHGEAVLAANVASEAQITDLQLTFLLSMAQKYKWSSWQGLLLDDPTQHHDLVHASGVFDLLRDYIVDHNFQVLLATHDAVQANFFMRKLENDGIPAKLWNLESTEKGVIAKAY